jgi:septum formation protein
MHELLLASASPRRKELLEKAGFSFKVFPVNVSEKIEKNLNLDEQILAIARRKARAALEAYKSTAKSKFIVLAADTLVILDNIALGKPADGPEAQKFLGLLSGREHQVKTAVILIEGSTSVEVSAVETTKVWFRKLSLDEIRDYVNTGEPMDKAGAYAIQGIGGKFVEEILGPYDNVVGLPIETLRNLLVKSGWKV